MNIEIKSVKFEDSLFENCYFEDVRSTNTYFENCTIKNTVFYNTGRVLYSVQGFSQINQFVPDSSSVERPDKVVQCLLCCSP